MSTAVRPLLPVLSVHSSCAMRRPCRVRNRAADTHAFADSDAAIARAFGERQSQVGGIRLAIARKPHAAFQIGSRHERIALARLCCGDHVAGDAERLGDRRRSLQLDHAVGRAGDGQRAALLPPGRKPRFIFEARIKLGRVADQPRHALVVAQLPHEPGGVPRRAGCQPSLLEQHDIGLATRAQVVRDRAAHDAAADHHDPRRLRRLHLRRQSLVRHRLPRFAFFIKGAAARPLRRPPLKSILSGRAAAVAVSDARATRRVAYIAHALLMCHAFGRVKVSMP